MDPYLPAQYLSPKCNTLSVSRCLPTPITGMPSPRFVRLGAYAGTLISAMAVSLWHVHQWQSASYRRRDAPARTNNQKIHRSSSRVRVCKLGPGLELLTALSDTEGPYDEFLVSMHQVNAAIGVSNVILTTLSVTPRQVTKNSGCSSRRLSSCQ